MSLCPKYKVVAKDWFWEPYDKGTMDPRNGGFEARASSFEEVEVAFLELAEKLKDLSGLTEQQKKDLKNYYSWNLKKALDRALGG